MKAQAVEQQNDNRAPSTKSVGGTSLLALCLSLLVGGCAVAADGELSDEDLRALEEPIRNGTLLPTSLNGGTARVRIWGPTGNTDCSGQVISRDTVLTAAHCLYDAGYYADGWEEEQIAAVYVRHQEPSGTWEHLIGLKEDVTAFVPQKYVEAKERGERGTGYDIALLRRSINLSNSVSTDVTALAVYSGERPRGLYAYGHGLYDDQLCDRGGCDPLPDDDQLRSGLLRTLTWYNDPGQSNYRMIMSDYTANDPNLCLGDSGGPWKLAAYAPEASTPLVNGVQFGVTAFVEGGPGGGCGADKAYATWIAHHDPWIREIVEDGRGSCSRYDYQVQDNAPSNLPRRNIDQALVCW